MAVSRGARCGEDLPELRLVEWATEARVGEAARSCAVKHRRPLGRAPTRLQTRHDGASLRSEDRPGAVHVDDLSHEVQVRAVRGEEVHRQRRRASGGRVVTGRGTSTRVDDRRDAGSGLQCGRQEGERPRVPGGEDHSVDVIAGDGRDDCSGGIAGVEGAAGLEADHLWPEHDALGAHCGLEAVVGGHRAPCPGRSAAVASYPARWS